MYWTNNSQCLYIYREINHLFQLKQSAGAWLVLSFQQTSTSGLIISLDYFHRNSDISLTGFVCGVVILHEEGVPIVPDLLAGPGVVLRNERLQVGVEDAFAHADVDGRLALSSWYFQRLLPHRVHYDEKKKKMYKKKNNNPYTLGEKIPI